MFISSLVPQHGSISGGYLAAKTNRKRYGRDFYATIGAMGGRKSRGGGFAANPELARIAGSRGGRAKRRNQTIRRMKDTSAE